MTIHCKAMIYSDRSTSGHWPKSRVCRLALSNIELGKGNPTLAALNRVADALGLDLRLGVRSANGRRG
jgi:hypothetical protein